MSAVANSLLMYRVLIAVALIEHGGICAVTILN